MSRVQRLLAASILVAVASIVFAAVRLASSGDGASTAPQAPIRASSPGGSEGETAPAPAAARPVRAYGVRLRMGVPTPRSVRIQARVGDEIRLTVTSLGAEDDVIVNGYGQRAHVGPGRPARLRVVTTLAGSFDVVLQTSGVKVADLDVSS